MKLGVAVFGSLLMVCAGSQAGLEDRADRDAERPAVENSAHRPEVVLDASPGEGRLSRTSEPKLAGLSDSLPVVTRGPAANSVSATQIILLGLGIGATTASILILTDEDDATPASSSAQPISINGGWSFSWTLDCDLQDVPAPTRCTFVGEGELEFSETSGSSNVALVVSEQVCLDCLAGGQNPTRVCETRMSTTTAVRSGSGIGWGTSDSRFIGDIMQNALSGTVEQTAGCLGQGTWEARR